MVRVLLAGLLGGLVIFFCGAAVHMGLNLESRTMMDLPDEPKFGGLITKNGLAPGLYAYPGYEQGLTLTGEARAAWEKQFIERYQAGPVGILLVGPSGEEPMGAKQLQGEFVADVIAALIAAILLSQTAPGLSFFRRWSMVALLAPLSWASLTYSYYLWYRFPFNFILDGLFGAIIEWSIAGLVIAALVKPKTTQPTTPPAA
ncbi:MAG: hypothetical protein U0892_20630 [Pirellulales bacterium]